MEDYTKVMIFIHLRPVILKGIDIITPSGYLDLRSTAKFG